MKREKRGRVAAMVEGWGEEKERERKKDPRVPIQQ